MAMGPRNDYDESRNRGFEEKKVLSVLRYRDSVWAQWPVQGILVT